MKGGQQQSASQDYSFVYKSSQAPALDYCRKTLADVSRSFALTIPMIDAELRDKITVGYLVARILDTIEDSPMPLGLKKILMDEWIELISQESFDSTAINSELIRLRLKSLVSRSSDYIKDVAYCKLVKNSFHVYVATTKFDKRFILFQYKWFRRMKNGMKKYLTRKISSFADLDEYTYCVAGTVGGFLTDLVCEGVADRRKRAILKKTYRDFGLLLQKVNVIRDFRQDVLENRHFWPSSLLGKHSSEDLLKEENKAFALYALSCMIKDAKAHVKNAKKYIDNMPPNFRGYRMFARVNFQMALQTLEKMENNPEVFLSSQPVKIGRQNVARILIAAQKECMA